MRPQSLTFALLLGTTFVVGCGQVSPSQHDKTVQAPSQSTLPLSHLASMHLGEQPAAFEVEDITGPAAGESLCYRCRYSGRPTVVIFAREVDDSVTHLVQKIDQEVSEHTDQKLSAFMVVLDKDTSKVESELKRIQAKQDIRNTPLTVFHNPEGPAGYTLSPAAKVQVMMWNKEGIKVNQPIQGNLSPEEISHLVAQTKTILN